MAFEDRFSRPLDGHELAELSGPTGISWCLRCGTLRLDARPGLRDRASWEAPGQAGRSISSEAPPACRGSTTAGAPNTAGDVRLMLHALTHGWRCEPVLLQIKDRTEAWRWSFDGLLGGEAWSVAGAWGDGPVIDDAVRRVLLARGKGA